MLQWMKRLFQPPQPVGPAQIIKRFSKSDATITRDVVTQHEDGWLVDVAETRTVRLFDVKDPKVENCMVTYRADLKSNGVRGRGYLEMWCRIPGRGEFFSKGFHNALKGTNDWGSYEIPFYLKRGQRPDLIKLNLMLEGRGQVWIKNVELSFVPFA